MDHHRRDPPDDLLPDLRVHPGEREGPCARPHHQARATGLWGDRGFDHVGQARQARARLLGGRREVGRRDVCCESPGPARVISHAVFAGLAGGVGAFLVVLMAGREHIASVYVLMLAGVVGAAVVGQLLVGSSNGLSRPFGYFGGVLGITFAGLLLYPLDHSMLLVLTAFCFAGPWT